MATVLNQKTEEARMRGRQAIQGIWPVLAVAALLVLAPRLGPHPTKSDYPISAIVKELAIQDGDKVADIGSGDGRLTFPIAEHVGREGRVFAVDIDRSNRFFVNLKAGFGTWYPQVTAVHSKVDDPLLPANTVDVVFMIISYHEMTEYQAMLMGVFKAMKSGARLGIIDVPGHRSKNRAIYGGEHFIPQEVVIEDATAAGFRYLRSVDPVNPPRFDFGSSYYFVIFEKPQ